MTRGRGAFTLVELLIVMGLLALLIAILLPALAAVRRSAMVSKMATDASDAVDRSAVVPTTQPSLPASTPPAHVDRFDASVDLTPRLSVGTDQPESIYEAVFDGTITAHGNGAPGECAIHLPLPPQIVSLGDVRLSLDGEPTESVSIEQDQLVWRGPLGKTPSTMTVHYAAVGRGLFAMSTPPGKIVGQFKVALTAHGSDVRMLELSMQPTQVSRAPQQTTYLWDYHQLVFGRPIAVDVLGIAPIDRLGELRWLGPVSVVAFGLVIGLMSRAFAVGNFDRWMLLLVLGTFTGAYPMMYFAQQFISLPMAMLFCGGLVQIIIAARMITIVGWRIGLFGMSIPSLLIMGLALCAAIYPNLQGILLTGLVLGLFVLAMLLAPRFTNFQPFLVREPAPVPERG